MIYRVRCSVCIATFNGEDFIKRQIESIIYQLSPDDEIIISDDGSLDNTINIINDFNDPRIKIFQNIIKSGPIGNFENAINHASGEYIFLCDQDDIWLENKINTHLKLHTYFGLVLSDAIVVNESLGIIYPSFFEARGSKNGIINNLIKNSFLGCCLSFKSSLNRYILPFPVDIHMHDWWIGLVCLMYTSVCFCPERLILYVRHNKNASPTLSESGYSLKTKFMNRWVLLYNLMKLIVRLKGSECNNS